MKYLLGFFILICCFSSANAGPKIFIDVGEARVRKSKLALPAFQYLGAKSSGTKNTSGDELYSVINNDLAATGLFISIDPNAYLENPMTTGLRPASVVPNGFDFANWKTIETEFLIRGGFQIINNTLILEIYGYYVPQGTLVLGKKYEGPASSARKIAHTFADDFVKAVTGKPGFFKSQIVVAIDNGVKTNREIYVADWDGHDAYPVTNHKTITVSPTWSKNGNYIAYTAYAKRVVNGLARRNPDLFMYEFKTKRRWLVSYRDGLNSGAEFLPDNKHMLLTLSRASQTGTADIYKMTLDGTSISPITRGPGSAMNVEPAVSPDGRTIAFSSDRSGKPMIYTMSMNGENVKKLTHAGNYNATPSWSPDGKKIAFAGFDNDRNNFDIFLINADGSGIIRLSSARKTNDKWSNNEDPAFSPDGRHVLFVSDRTGTKQLYLVNIDGSNERRITYDGKFYSKPKWGPLVE
ncbi:MAG: hypothetical protein A2Z20_02755 [Bdellovibrionales bacterium RBG_16_40_8]|nr:MAG: hypothetical protein A2Z20_02755 [Bdellovibrionales bacterium RBG_16_40_8]